jgi:hypothetical protein
MELMKTKNVFVISRDAFKNACLNAAKVSSYSLKTLSLLIGLLVLIGLQNTIAQDFNYYAVGSPVLTELYVDPINGNDANNGQSLTQAVRTLHAAFGLIPSGTLASTGYRINLLDGDYPYDEAHSNYYDNKTGSYQYPIIVSGLTPSSSARIIGGMNLKGFAYLYLMNLTLWAGSEAGSQSSNNVLHLEACNHVLLRKLLVQGDTSSPLADTNNSIQEVLKINQAHHVFVEHCEFLGTFQTVVDYFAVQYGHIRNCKIHQSGGRGFYCKGGSAYLLVHANEVYNCREAGIQAGEGSNFPLMVPPWIHYEAYDIKIVNNRIHDIYGAGLTCAGGYNILMAYNTLCRIGLDHPYFGASYGLVELVHGSRACYPADELGGATGTKNRALELLAMGGWGTAVLYNSGYWIPNRKVFIYNNIFYNPSGYGTRYIQFIANGWITPPTGSNIPNPSYTDDSVVFKGNLVWNQTIEPGELIGSNNGSVPGCQLSTSCNPDSLLANNLINELEPQFEDPANNNFLPAAGGNLSLVTASVIPSFFWDAPTTPIVPTGTLTNDITMDCIGIGRALPAIPGAHVLTSTGLTTNPPATLAKVVYSPISKTIQVSLVKPISKLTLTISDSSGKTIYSKPLELGDLEIPVANQALGLYLVSISNGIKWAETHKVLITN